MSNRSGKGSKSPGESLKKEDIVQAVVLVDGFTAAFDPFSRFEPTSMSCQLDPPQPVSICCNCEQALFPLVNTALLDYTLEFLVLSGVEEVILFCSSHTELIKQHVRSVFSVDLNLPILRNGTSTSLYLYNSSVSCHRTSLYLYDSSVSCHKTILSLYNTFSCYRASKWTHPLSTTVVNVIVSEGCRSLGDVMRDLDGKGVIRSDFVLLHGDTVANLQLLPILEYHRKLQKQDKGAAMTLLYKETGLRPKSHALEEETVLGTSTATSRVLFHQKLSHSTKKINFPLEMFLDEPEVQLLYSLQDTDICICSPAVPPLFSDNFDFQTRDDLIRGLLVDDEILTSTIYWYKLKSSEYAARVRNWPMYQAIRQVLHTYARTRYYHDVIHRWAYPLVPDLSLDNSDDPYIFLRRHVYRQRSATLCKLVFVALYYKNATHFLLCLRGCDLEEDVVLAKGTVVGENTQITRSVIGQNCRIGKNCDIADSYIWNNVVIEVSRSITELKKIGPKAVMVLAVNKDVDSEDEQEGPRVSGLTLVGEEEEGEDSSESSDQLSTSSDLSYRASPVPDDTSFTRSLYVTPVFFNEVMDSLSRGYDDKLQCDNLVLEINSSRYAYNVSVQEVNYHVVRALVSLPSPDNYWGQLRMQLGYFLPILVNYIRNQQAQEDCLQALEEVATSRKELRDSLLKLLHLLYEQEILGEEAILKWHSSPDLDDPAATPLRTTVEPFIKWLQEADEESD
uniref:Translation initiation factor eIF2B subunit epsilon n=1 Tax=Timema cristinae TaxID=61476 RepID=A0A7R9CQY4_TIMCR|nr:unnamed protein product [Timema cristinae]